jgi:hypothetical protein
VSLISIEFVEKVTFQVTGMGVIQSILTPGGRRGNHGRFLPHTLYQNKFQMRYKQTRKYSLLFCGLKR